MKNWINKMTGGLVAMLLLASSSAFAQTVTWGNTYMRGGNQTATVNPTSSQWVTFTADAADTITDARLYAAPTATITGSPVLDVGLYAVDVNGVPTGAALASGSVTATATGWTSVSLSSYTLTAGTTYALRVSTATSGAAFPWQYTNENPANTIQPVGTPDAHWRRGNNNDNPAASGQNTWTLGTTSGKTIGQPYISATAQSVVSASNTIGQRFVFDQAGAGGNNLLESVTLYLGVVGTAPTSPVTLKLIDAAGTVLATSQLDLSGAALNTVAMRTFSLDTPISLTDDNVYYLGLYTPAGTLTWYGWNVTNDPYYINASYQGADAYGVSWASQSVYTSPTAVNTRDYYFALGLAVPEPSVVLLTGLGLAFMLLSTLLKRRRF